MPFREKIPGCFGSVDKKFAGHPLDTGRAKEMLIEALGETSSWKEFEDAIRSYLAQEKCSTDHIEEQIEQVKNTKSYFAND